MNVLRSELLDPVVVQQSTADGGEPRREVARLIRMVRRNWVTLVVAGIVALVLGAFFVATVEPTYRSNVRILLDQNRTGETSEVASFSQGNNIDEYIATQVAIVQSDVIFRRVAAGMRLDDEGTLVTVEDGSSVVPLPDPQTERSVMNALRRMVSVYRLDRSFVMEIATSSADPALSRLVADAVGSAYIADQTESYAQSLTQAGNWLQERIDDLRLQSLEASEAVERFRAESGIRATEGQLISDQQLTGLSNQSVLAEANVARLQSRYDVYSAAIDSGDVVTLTGLLSTTEPGDAVSPGSVGSDYLAALERERAVRAALGEDNTQLPAIRAEIDRLSRLVLVEARGRLAAYQNELEAARAQVTGLEDSMMSAATRSETSNLPLVVLRSLEQRANSLQTLYQTYLSRYQETLQRQSLPLNGARKISDAEEPSRPVFPNPTIVLAFALVVGVGAGATIAIGREFFDNSIRTPDQLKRLGLETVGHAPRIRDAAQPTREARLQKNLLGRTLLSAVMAAPARGPHLVAFVSAGHGEGRSFLTRLLAEANGLEGFQTAIIDLSQSPSGLAADPRRRPFWRFRRASAGAAAPKRTDASERPIPQATRILTVASFQDLRRLSPRTGGTLPEEFSSCNLMAFDLPPLWAAAELRAVADAVDVIFLVAEWGRTDADVVREMLSGGTSFQNKVAGAVLTKVDARGRRRYEARRPLVVG